MRSSGISMQHILSCSMSWRRQANGYDLESEVDGHSLVAEIGDFPDEPLYRIIMDGQLIGEIDDWPACWKQAPVETVVMTGAEREARRHDLHQFLGEMRARWDDG